MSFNDNKDNYKESAFNPAIEKLKMLCRALDICSLGRFNNDVNLWYKGLVDYRVQIYSKLSDKEKQDLEKLMPELTKLMKQCFINGKYKINPELYKKMDDFEIKLRDMAEKHKLGIPDSDDPAFAILN